MRHEKIEKPKKIRKPKNQKKHDEKAWLFSFRREKTMEI
jgi:hypothetical protein